MLVLFCMLNYEELNMKKIEDIQNIIKNKEKLCIFIDYNNLSENLENLYINEARESRDFRVIQNFLNCSYLKVFVTYKKNVSYRCPQNTDEYLKTSLFVNDMEEDFLDNQPLFTAKKNISTGNRITDSIKLIVRNFTDKKQVRAELDEIYKKHNLGKGDTRYLSDEPEFF